MECIVTVGRVGAAGSVLIERGGGFKKGGESFMGVSPGAVVFVKRAGGPGAFFFVGGGGRGRPPPTGSINRAGGFLSEKKKTTRRIESAAGETKQGVLPF